MPGVTVFKLFFILFAGFAVALPFSTSPSPTQAGQASESSYTPDHRQSQPAPAETTTSIFNQEQWADRRRRNTEPSFPQATMVEVLPRDIKLVLDIPQYQKWERREVDSGLIRRNNSNHSFFAKIQWDESD